VIADDVKIGRHCLIRSNSVIGEEGFGFEYEEDGTPIRIPHLGSVEIGDFVEIGNFTAIARGTLKNTIIHSHVKIDNLVHIAHNCIIGEKSMVIACAEVSGSSIVGKKCWLGAGCSTMQKIKIGDNCLIGIGAVVLKDVLPGAVMAGNPAKLIRMRD
jgi:UDP-3-O-[3-hydroxymyristoyl] glucosamine N-acyltransferase